MVLARCAGRQRDGGQNRGHGTPGIAEFGEVEREVVETCRSRGRSAVLPVNCWTRTSCSRAHGGRQIQLERQRGRRWGGGRNLAFCLRTLGIEGGSDFPRSAASSPEKPDTCGISGNTGNEDGPLVYTPVRLLELHALVPDFPLPGPARCPSMRRSTLQGLGPCWFSGG